jgi:hypothetical protein
LFEIGFAFGVAGEFDGASVTNRANGDKDADNGNDNQQFNQGETLLELRF